MSKSNVMSNTLQNCSNCGGRMAHAPDGRSVSCVYCGSGSVIAVDPRALAAGIAVDSKSVHAGFEKLLVTFRETLPSETTVYESGLFVKKPHSFDVTLDEFKFRLTREGQKLIAQRVTIAGGITLKTETMNLEAWITALAEKLSEMAQASAAARDAFSRLT